MSDDLKYRRVDYLVADIGKVKINGKKANIIDYSHDKEEFKVLWLDNIDIEWIKEGKVRNNIEKIEKSDE